MKRSIALLLTLALSHTYASAESTDLNQKYVHYFATEYAKYKTLKELISATNIPFAEYIFLKRKFNGYLDDKPPEVREIDGTWQFITKEMTVTVKPISLSKKIFEFNGKRLSLLNVGPVRKWDLIAQTLPKTKSAGLIDLMLPRADAWEVTLAKVVGGLVGAAGLTATGGSIFEFFANRTKEKQQICVMEYVKALALCKGTASEVAIAQRQGAGVAVSGQLPARGSATSADQASANAQVVKEVASAREKGEKEDCSKLPISESLAKLNKDVLAATTLALATESNALLFQKCDEDRKKELDKCVGEMVGVASSLCMKSGEAAWTTLPENKAEAPTPEAMKTGNAMPDDVATSNLPSVQEQERKEMAKDRGTQR